MALSPYHRPSPRRIEEPADFDDEPTGTFATLTSIVRPIVIVTPATPLAEIRRIFLDGGPPAIAVVDDRDWLRGVITRTDVLRAIDGCAADVMAAGGFALAASAPVERAALMMAEEGIGYVIIVGDGGQLVGIASVLDVLRQLLH